MKFKSKAQKKEIDLTSMIDVTFLLIAFFMVLINFSEADQNERIKLPASELAKPPDEAPAQLVMLQILKSGNIIYDNIENDLDGLKKKLEFHVRFLKEIKVKPKTATVIVRADGKCETSKVQDVIELCQMLTFENFKLRAKQSDK